MPEAVTPWFPGDVKPVRVGVYERALCATPWSCWDGVHWMLPGRTPDEAMKHYDRPSASQEKPWRGLAADPALKG